MDKRGKFVALKLVAIKRKHEDYFAGQDFTFTACLKINWDTPMSSHVVNAELPFDICYDIETMFWVE